MPLARHDNIPRLLSCSMCNYKEVQTNLLIMLFIGINMLGTMYGHHPEEVEHADASTFPFQK